MAEKKSFGLGTILSITTGRLLTSIDNVYEILNFMTRDNLFTHQLPRASKECAPWILRQHPQLKDVDASNVTKDNLQEYLKQQIDFYDISLEIEPIQRDDHDYKNPLEELKEMTNAEIIIVNPDEIKG